MALFLCEGQAQSEHRLATERARWKDDLAFRLGSKPRLYEIPSVRISSSRYRLLSSFGCRNYTLSSRDNHAAILWSPFLWKKTLGTIIAITIIILLIFRTSKFHKCLCAVMFAMLVPLLVSVFWARSSNVVEAQAADGNVGCAFHLSCAGAFNGSIGEKSSGQARAASDVVPSMFTWFGDAFADQQGSGCWWTPPTYTLQCDQNQTPDHGFGIGCDGSVSFNGQTVFYECPTGVGDEVNIYLQYNGDQCHEITIAADSCAPSTCPGGGVAPAGGSSPSSGQTNTATTSVSAVSSVSSASSASSASSMPSVSTIPSTLVTLSLSLSTTPISSISTGPPIPSPFTSGIDMTSTSPTSDLTTTTSITSTSTVTTTQPAPTSSDCAEVGPDQIILIDQGNPDTAYGPNKAKHIQISPNASTIFNFRFEDTDLGKTCELSFRIPHGRPYNLTGTGLVTVAALDGFGAANTTYNTAPRIIQPLDNLMLYEGMQHGFGAFPCPGSISTTGILLAEGPMADTCLDCVQGGGLGMFMRKC